MVEGNGDWLRARGIGRERFAGYLTEYLGSIGYRVERSEVTEPMETRITGELEKMSPSVPPAAHTLAFRLYPTSGGAAVVWQAPTEVPPDQKPRMDRLVREMESHLERAVHTESHATAKVVRPSAPHLPWSTPAAAPSGT
ncbi:MAG TPA: hypothetical protein VK424_06945 [Thermoplasmata archaeon]|nr:hypothetical protein [Thermoplasmata archaeon]